MNEIIMSLNLPYNNSHYNNSHIFSFWGHVSPDPHIHSYCACHIVSAFLFTISALVKAINFAPESSVAASTTAFDLLPPQKKKSRFSTTEMKCQTPIAKQRKLNVRSQRTQRRNATNPTWTRLYGILLETAEESQTTKHNTKLTKTFATKTTANTAASNQRRYRKAVVTLSSKDVPALMQRNSGISSHIWFIRMN